MEEKKLTDEQDNLLIEFDGYGFAPTITMPNAEEYAFEWKKRLIRVFDSQKAEIERLKEKFSISHYKDSWKNKFFKAQEEIERLTAFKDEAISLSLYEVGLKDGKALAEKDTAKQIYDELKNEVISVDIPCGGEPAEEDCRAVLWWKIEQILRKKAQVE